MAKRPLNETEKKFKINFNDYFSWGMNNLKQFEDDNLVRLKKDKITVTEMGKLLIRNIAINFDKYIESKEDTAKYSKTI
ncbi:MAG: hypothetical protein IIC75_04795 [Bacteroidetes bacterium]|nr:hypothetical protein [Bacteroidota bacterium]